jgi:hypothetical protein
MRGRSSSTGTAREMNFSASSRGSNGSRPGRRRSDAGPGMGRERTARIQAAPHPDIRLFSSHVHGPELRLRRELERRRAVRLHWEHARDGLCWLTAWMRAR